MEIFVEVNEETIMSCNDNKEIVELLKRQEEREKAKSDLCLSVASMIFVGLVIYNLIKYLF
jgi:hypothetical protein